MYFKSLCLVLVFVNFVNFSTAQLAEGDICQHKKTGTQGICKHAGECDEAIQLIIRGLKPQRCGFDGIHSIVCCPGKPGGKEEGNDDKEKVKRTAEGSKNETEMRIVGQISKEGSICNHSKTNAQGVCKHAAECDEAIQLIIRGLKPQRCSLDGPKSIVCCPGNPGGKEKEKDEWEEVKVTANSSANKTVTRMGEISEESDICHHKETGTQGICKHAAECDEAIQQIIRGLHPQRCGFNGLHTIVCCPGKPGGNGSENETATRTVRQISKDGDTCYHEKTNSQGICKFVQDCEEAKELVIFQDLPPSECGFVGNDQLVCCPKQPLGVKKNGTTIELRKPGDTCFYEKTGSQGICKFVQDCEEAKKLVTVQDLPPSECGFVGNDQLVCCQPLEVKKNGTEIESRKPGDTCFYEKNSSQGICKFVQDCKEAMELGMVQDLPPSKCGFVGKNQLVCCPKEPLEVEKNGSKVVPRISGETAKEKCVEYSKYGWINESSPILLPGADIITRSTCSFNVTELIIGGTDAEKQDFPHMVLIGYDVQGVPQYECGGSLISEQFVLTAAHCVHDRVRGVAKFAKMGLIDRDAHDNVQNFSIVEIKYHPEYRPPYTENDIGLAKLHKKADLNPWVRPACLYIDKFSPKSNVIVTGWGKIGVKGLSKILQKVVLQLVDADQCQNSYSGSSRLRDGVNDSLIVCTKSPKGHKDSCEGDSGGPVQVYNENMNCMYDIVGVISHGLNCAFNESVPALSTRVSYFVQWIENIVWP